LPRHYLDANVAGACPAQRHVGRHERRTEAAGKDRVEHIVRAEPISDAERIQQQRADGVTCGGQPPDVIERGETGGLAQPATPKVATHDRVRLGIEDRRHVHRLASQGRRDRGNRTRRENEIEGGRGVEDDQLRSS
jgi:hypothetical protein